MSHEFTVINQLSICFIALSLFIIGHGSLQAQDLQTAVDTQGNSSSYRADLDRYCVTCHNETMKTANLMLDRADFDDIASSPELWEKVLLKLQTRSMPPVGMPRPDENFYESFSTHLVDSLDDIAAANPNPGRTVSSHRLNRTEYTNVIRDLLAVNIDGVSLLPPDNSGEFDNLGDLLSVSPVLMEKYMKVAREVSRLAVGDTSIDGNSKVYTISPMLLQHERMNEDLPFGTRGGMSANHRFPLDGEYEISVRLQRTDDTGLVIGMSRPHHLDILVDGKRIDLLRVGGDNVALALGAKTGDTIPPNYQQTLYETTADANLMVRFPIKAGERSIQVAFLEDNYAWEDQVPERNNDNLQTARIPRNYDYERAFVDPSVSSITINGPFNAEGPGNTVSREKIFICMPDQTISEEACARQILSSLTRRAWRRQLSDAEINPFIRLFQKGREEGGRFESGIQVALQGLLVSSEFLFRVYRTPSVASGDGMYPLNDLELASRLSFFIWSSIPDNELLAIAEEGRLGDPAVLAQQVKRMLADERSETLVNNFAEQWLLLRNLPHTSKDYKLFPGFDESLRDDLKTETQLFLSSIFRADRSILDLFRADYKYINERLAKHYGIPGVMGNKFRRVTVAEEELKGLLAQGSILAITAYPNRTSPVLRGKWVLENILASPPPPPPNDIPALVEVDDHGNVLTMREAIEKHRANPVCAVCHNRMDPIGFGLENFDPIGQWRTVDAGQLIDSTGMLPDGSTFQGPSQLQQALLGKSPVIASAFTQKLLTYALGRDLAYYDMPAVRHIVSGAAGSEYRFSDIVSGIVNSLPFRMRNTGQ
jgi:hypothetical protein